MSDASVDSETFRFTATQDWFSHNIPIWSKFLPYVQASAPRALEIGSWEGRSGVWLLRNLCSHSGFLVCIDHFDLMATEAGRQRYSDLLHNLTLAGPGQFRIMKSFSFPALMELLGENIGASDPGFDWIYIDGSHEADDTCENATIASGSDS
jgi:predicted O-methyltransferase YrrM